MYIVNIISSKFFIFWKGGERGIYLVSIYLVCYYFYIFSNFKIIYKVFKGM